MAEVGDSLNRDKTDHKHESYKSRVTILWPVWTLLTVCFWDLLRFSMFEVFLWRKSWRMSVKNMKITHKFSLFLGGQREKTVGFHLPPKKRKNSPSKKKNQYFFPHLLSCFLKLIQLDEGYQAKTVDLEDEKCLSFTQQENASSDKTNFPCVLLPIGIAFIHAVLSFLGYSMELVRSWMETLQVISREPCNSDDLSATSWRLELDLNRSHIYILPVQGSIFQTCLSLSPPTLSVSDSRWEWLQNYGNSKTRHFVLYFWYVRKCREWEMSGGKPALGDILFSDKRDLEVQPPLF